MASIEGQSRTSEQNGMLVRNTGLGILAVGLLGEIGLLTAIGAGTFATAEVFLYFIKRKETKMEAGKKYSPKAA